MFSENLDLQIVSRRFLKLLLMSKLSGVNQEPKANSTEPYLIDAVIAENELIIKLIKYLMIHVQTTSENLTLSFQISKTVKFEQAQRELMDLTCVLCYRKEFRRKLSSSINIADIDCLFSREKLCNFANLTFPLINLLLKIREELPIVNRKFGHLVEDSTVLQQCGKCLNSNSDKNSTKEALTFLYQCFYEINLNNTNREKIMNGLCAAIYKANREKTKDQEKLQKQITEREEEIVSKNKMIGETYRMLQKQRNEQDSYEKRATEQFKKKTDCFEQRIKTLQNELDEKESNFSRKAEAWKIESENCSKRMEAITSENENLKRKFEKLQRKLNQKENQIKENVLEQNEKEKQIPCYEEKWMTLY
eukprot:UN25210